MSHSVPACEPFPCTHSLIPSTRLDTITPEAANHKKDTLKQRQVCHIIRAQIMMCLLRLSLILYKHISSQICVWFQSAAQAVRPLIKLPARAQQINERYSTKCRGTPMFRQFIISNFHIPFPVSRARSYTNKFLWNFVIGASQHGS